MSRQSSRFISSDVSLSPQAHPTDTAAASSDVADDLYENSPDVEAPIPQDETAAIDSEALRTRPHRSSSSPIEPFLRSQPGVPVSPAYTTGLGRSSPRPWLRGSGPAGHSRQSTDLTGGSHLSRAAIGYNPHLRTRSASVSAGIYDARRRVGTGPADYRQGSSTLSQGSFLQQPQQLSPEQVISGIPARTSVSTESGDSQYASRLSNVGVRDGLVYTLIVVQHPTRARMCGLGDKDRRPLSATPVVKLKVSDATTGQEVFPFDVNTSLLVVQAALHQADGTPFPPPQQAVEQRAITFPLLGPAALSEPYSQGADMAWTPLSAHPGMAFTSSPLPVSAATGMRSRSMSEAWLLSGSTDLQSRLRTSPPLVPPDNILQQLSFPSSAGDEVQSAGSTGTVEGVEGAGTYGMRPSSASTTSSQPGLESNVGGDPLPASSPRNMVGVAVASASVLRDEEDELGIFFALPDISVRLEGTYTLCLTLTDLSRAGYVNEGVSHSIAEVMTEPFVVYAPRRFPGMMEPTSLSRKLASQGVKIPIRTNKERQSMDTAASEADFERLSTSSASTSRRATRIVDLPRAATRGRKVTGGSEDTNEDDEEEDEEGERGGDGDEDGDRSDEESGLYEGVVASGLPG